MGIFVTDRTRPGVSRVTRVTPTIVGAGCGTRITVEPMGTPIPAAEA